MSQRLRASVHDLEGQINFHLRNGCQVSVQQQNQAQREEVRTYCWDPNTVHLNIGNILVRIEFSPSVQKGVSKRHY